MKRLLLIVNPVAGKGKAKKQLPEATNIFKSHGYEVTVYLTKPNGGTEEFVAEKARDFDLIVAIGGDGTLNTVASAIIKSGTDLPMGYIPLGSTNDFGKSLGLPKKVKDACERIAVTAPKDIDVGVIGGRYFVYIACTGLFTSASYSTSQRMKNIFGHAAYLFKGFFDLFRAKKVHYSIETDQDSFEGDYLYAGFSNTLSIAGVFSLKKSGVSFDDGVFEFTAIKAPTGPLNGLALLGNIATSNIHTHRFERRKIKRAVIKTHVDCQWSIDGENGGSFDETVIEVQEKALKFIY